MSSLRLSVEVQHWPYAREFKITGHVWKDAEVVLVRLEDAMGRVGCGEGMGVHYRGETAGSIAAEIECVRQEIEVGVSREALRSVLPPGGARNALDSALWDLEAHASRRSAWSIARMSRPRPIVTTFTCGAESPEQMVEAALGYKGAKAIKLKLTGEAEDAERVRRVREALPRVWLSVDANMGFTPGSLEGLLPVLEAADVAMIEQPFPIGDEAWLDRISSPIPIAADESVQHLGDISKVAGRFQTINIKLDKCGGLTEGLEMARAAREAGLGLMVGCMGGTSISMAPAFLLGQLCDIADLDGPALLKRDRPNGVRYVDGEISCEDLDWGLIGAEASVEAEHNG